MTVLPYRGPAWVRRSPPAIRKPPNTRPPPPRQACPRCLQMVAAISLERHARSLQCATRRRLQQRRAAGWLPVREIDLPYLLAAGIAVEKVERTRLAPSWAATALRALRDRQVSSANIRRALWAMPGIAQHAELAGLPARDLAVALLVRAAWLDGPQVLQDRKALVGRKELLGWLGRLPALAASHPALRPSLRELLGQARQVFEALGTSGFSIMSDVSVQRRIVAAEAALT